MSALLKTNVPTIRLYKRVFTDEECSELMGMLMCKAGIEWDVCTNQLEQTRSIVSFGYKRFKDIRRDPHPISKNMDIFSLVNAQIHDILQELENDNLIEFNNRIIDQWICYLYEDGEQCSPEIDCAFNPGTPIIIIVLGKSRNIIVKSKKTGRSVLNKKVKNGSIICLFEEFGKYYTYQMPMMDCSGLHIQMFGSFSKFRTY